MDLDKINPTELQAMAALLMQRAAQLPEGSPERDKRLQAARHLLDVALRSTR